MSTPTRPAQEPAISDVAAPASEVGVMPLDVTIRVKLSIMMFLQYFTWGAWFVTLGTYLTKGLGWSGTQVGWAYAASPIGAIVAPFFVGMIADRFFATQRILSVLHLLGAVLLGSCTVVGSFNWFMPLVIIYFLCYQPTIALTNSLSFRQMSDPGRQFPGVRMIGTIGWIAAGLLVGLLKVNDAPIEDRNIPLWIAAVSSALLGIFCVALPDTPPAGAMKGRLTAREILGLDTIGMLKQWSFAVFVIGAFLVCIPMQFYYGAIDMFLNEIQFPNPAANLTIGQMCEIFFLLIMPTLFVRLGVKYMLLVGMLAWALRYVLFAYGNTGSAIWMLYVGILLHGICFDFFFVTAYIYVDKKAPPTLRASAQGFITLVTWGVSGLIGSLVWGRTADYFALGPDKHDWHRFWLVPAIAAGAVAIVFALLFRDHSADESPAAE